jgi:hypothetical protein
MEEELKDKIINTVRKEHGITLGRRDPIFAIITANDLILEEQLKQLNNIFELQLIEMEQMTKNYLENGKELLEKKLTLALHEAKKSLETPQQPTLKQEEKNILTNPLITTVIGFILGYGLSLFLL